MSFHFVFAVIYVHDKNSLYGIFNYNGYYSGCAWFLDSELSTCVNIKLSLLVIKSNQLICLGLAFKSNW